MKKNSVKLFFVSLISVLCVCSCSDREPNSTSPNEDVTVKDIVAQMTLKEKTMLVVGTGRASPPSFSSNSSESEDPFSAQLEKADPAYRAMVERIRRFAPGAAGRTAEIARLGIPTMVLADGPAGLRINPTRKDDNATYYCTAFPIETLLASTWDTDLVEKVGQAMGNEVLEYGVDVILGPGMNIHRNPLCGRNFEYYSEDPLVSGKMGAAMVRGVQSQGVGTSIKHYAANNQETNRNSVDTIVSERALREIYLEGFRIAVQEAQPWTVMSSYNKVNGLYTSESHDLLTKVLKHDWDFQGFVMTDWGGGIDVVAQMNAGNDLVMPGNVTQYETIMTAVKEGKIDERVLDENVERILNIALKTQRFHGYHYSDKPDLKAHAEIARRSAADGMVLLKNNRNALPLGEDIKIIATFGKTSHEIITGGTGSGDVSEAYSVSLIEGLENGGYIIDGTLQEVYENYLKEAKEKQPKSPTPFRPPPPIPEMEVDDAIIKQLAQKSDVALITIGRNSGEGRDRKAEAGDFYLTDTEKALIQDVSREFQSKGKKAIVILNIGGVIEVPSWRDFPDAILLAWQPGQETGNSIVDVISGKVNPSGKLASTFPISYDDVPSSKNFPGVELPVAEADKTEEEPAFAFRRRIPSRVVYEEDVYVGYRYYDKLNIPTAYEFGYGLSYTQFRYSNIKLSTEDFEGLLTVSVDIKNIGEVPGREAVQLYLSAPSNKIEKPLKELKAFGKTDLLTPGQSQTLKFEINNRSLASFYTDESAWIAEAGSYNVSIGASLKDIRQTASFRLAKERLVKPVSRALAPPIKIKPLQFHHTLGSD